MALLALGCLAATATAQTLRFPAPPSRVNEGDAVQFTYLEPVNATDANCRLLSRAYPAGSGRAHDDKLVFKLPFILSSEEGLEQAEDIFAGRRMHPKSDDATVAGERQHSPITKVPVQGNQHAGLRNSLLEDFRIVRTAQSDITRLHDIMTECTKLNGHLLPEHLIQEQSHDSSGSGEFGELRVEDALLGEAQGGLNVSPCQGRKTGEDGVPGFTCRQLVEDDLDWNSGALDDRAAAADPGIDFNSFLHGLTFSHFGRVFKPLLPPMNAPNWRLSC